MNKSQTQALQFLSNKFSRRPLSVIDAKWIAMEGFFAGLPDLASLNIYAARFQKLWNTQEILTATRSFRKQMEKRVSSLNWTPPTPHENIGREVAISMAHFDLTAAIKWIAASGPDAEIEKNGRIDGMLTEWAWRNPATAMALLKKGPYGMRQKAITIGILRGDARLASDVVQLPGHGGSIGFALGISFAAAATIMEYDMYPGHGDVLPSHQARYEAFKEAIRIARIKGDRLQQLNRSLNGGFQYTVPEAKKAIRLAQNN